uniref:Uncharacterized protein n=1 Tax=Anguilla anguilla TaxID=7936 RepID=A0A0E9PHQ6_ANGAN
MSQRNLSKVPNENTRLTSCKIMFHIHKQKHTLPHSQKFCTFQKNI